MKFKNTRINHGGMMRCCDESLLKAKDLEDECREGETVQCLYSADLSHNWILAAGVWEWNRREPSEQIRLTPPSRPSRRN
jgi:hypothetical protein